MKTTITSVVLTILTLTTHYQVNAQAACFNPKNSYAIDAGPSSICYADFNGDGKIDLATANKGFGSSSVSILIGNGTGGFSAPTNFMVDYLPRAICAADFNGDGKTDLATANSGPGTVSILLGDGTGSFTATTGFGTGLYNWTQIASADFNGDSKADLIMTTSYNFVMLVLGNGNGSFATPTNITVNNGTYAICVDDFNGDMKADLAVTNYIGTTYYVSVLLGSTAGLGTATNFSVGIAPMAIVSADFNGDGKIDIATGNKLNYTTGGITVLLGNGSGGFAAASNFGLSANTLPQSICSADFNGDGKKDIATGSIINNSIPAVSVLLGDGMGNFGAAANFSVDSFPNGIIAADLNNDGKQDLALSTTKTTNDTGVVSVLLNCSLTGVNQMKVSDETITIYPSPNNGVFTIETNSGEKQIMQVYDVTGKLVLSQLLNGRTTIDAGNLNEGIFTVRIIGDKIISNKKMIITR